MITLYCQIAIGFGQLMVWDVCTGSQQLQVVEAAKQPLTLRPSVDFPAAVTAIYLAEDRSGWLSTHGHTIAGEADFLLLPVWHAVTEVWTT